MLYNEEDFLQLSGIQHFAFCRRQWALAYIELQWLENVRTVEGRLLHEKAHDSSIKEKRGELIITRALPVHSRELGISGECDVVEFHKAEEGISLSGIEGKYKVVPIEYKKGIPKADDIDAVQLAAQSMCLEEMLCCEISYGYIYYGETRHREKIDFTIALKEKVKGMFKEMHKYYEQRYTPKVKWSKRCNACSLKDVCVPALNKNISAAGYIERKIRKEEGIP
ncbi:CRISPR-associated protein Cas4 [Mediterraneibacter gnavus]|uniref:CRISPR-associated protein Cas4 n=1 Tax=Mediterraneibacter gnavus TaxID=33038 RepID=UPI0035660912